MQRNLSTAPPVLSVDLHLDSVIDGAKAAGHRKRRTAPWNGGRCVQELPARTLRFLPIAPTPTQTHAESGTRELTALDIQDEKLRARKEGKFVCASRQRGTMCASPRFLARGDWKCCVLMLPIDVSPANYSHPLPQIADSFLLFHHHLMSLVANLFVTYYIH